MIHLRSPRFEWLLHVAVWLLIMGTLSLLFYGETVYGLSHRFFVISTLYHIGLFYLNALLLYPALLTRRRWWLYLLFMVMIVTVSYYAKVYLLQRDPLFVLTPENKRVIFFSIIPLLAGSMIYRLISDKIRLEKSEKAARAERLDAELKFLRSQINPHFLFNVLTNMVALARKKSDLLEPSLIRLAELQRYALYDVGGQRVEVSRELEQLENYIALQQLRFGQQIQMAMKVNNESAECTMEPMLLIPFVENAYKHGAGSAERPYINVEVTVRDSKLTFSVTNNFNAESAYAQKDESSGIGLANIKSRLALLYPDKHRLIIKEEKDVYSVQLNLTLP